MHIGRFGSEAVILTDLAERPAVIAARIAALGHPGILDVVVGATSVTTRARSRALIPEIVDRLRDLDRGEGDQVAPTDHRPLEVPVVFDGPDLAEVAGERHLTVADLIAIVTRAPLEAAFTGFTAGFAYLEGLPEILHLPRRTTPRTSVPGGSVAIAGGYAGIYTVTSPGGWHIIGHTALELWNPDRDPPALIVPGMAVTLRAIEP